MKKYWSDGIAIAVLAFITSFVYKWVPQTYFQQDEWYSISQALLVKKDPSIIFHIISGVHFTPVAQLWFDVQYYQFGLNSTGYGLVSVLSHITVLVLAYILLRTFSVRILPAFFGIVFFALNPVSSQVVTWYSASVIGGPPVIFFLSASIIWIRNRKKNVPFYNTVSSLLFFFALLGKEDIITGFIVIFILSIFVIRKRIISYKPVIIPFVLWLIVYICAWAFGVNEQVTQHHKSISDSLSYVALIPVWMSNIFMTHDTLRSALQSLFGQYAMYFSFINDDRLLKAISLAIGGLFYISYFVTLVIRKQKAMNVLLFPALLVLSMLPYFLSFSNGLESRHYYLPVLITGNGIAWYLNWLLKKKYTSVLKFSLLMLTLLICVYGLSDQPNSDYIATQVKRRVIVTEMRKITKPSTKTVVYYIENGAGFPFQSGPGQMLLTLQGMHDSAFLPYMRTYFLWGMFEEGYKKIGQKGFGYYFDVNKLSNAYHKGVFDRSSIRAFSYDKNHLEFHNITTRIVQELQTNAL